MARFSFQRTVRAGRDAVFKALADPGNYPRLAPQFFPSTRVRSVRGNTSVVEEHMILGGIELVLMAKHVIEGTSLHEIFVIGGDARKSRITLSFADAADGGTALYVDADLRMGMTLRMRCMLRGGRLQDGYAEALGALADAA